MSLALLQQRGQRSYRFGQRDNFLLAQFVELLMEQFDFQLSLELRWNYGATCNYPKLTCTFRSSTLPAPA